jgi:hypothetical protein
VPRPESPAIPDAAGLALKEQYEWEAKPQWKGKPLAGDVAVSITLYFGTKRKASTTSTSSTSMR